MPRKKVKTLKRRPKFEEIRPETVFFLKYNRDPSQEEIPHNSFAQFGDPPGYLETVWQVIGDQITMEWIQENPGTRPHGWWSYNDNGDEYPEPDNQAAYLRKHNHLTPAELEALED